jgi:hypothetical protein
MNAGNCKSSSSDGHAGKSSQWLQHRRRPLQQKLLHSSTYSSDLPKPLRPFAYSANHIILIRYEFPSSEILGVLCNWAIYSRVSRACQLEKISEAPCESQLSLLPLYREFMRALSQLRLAASTHAGAIRTTTAVLRTSRCRAANLGIELETGICCAPNNSLIWGRFLKWLNILV